MGLTGNHHRAILWTSGRLPGPCVVSARRKGLPNERMVLRWVRIDWRMVGIGQYKIDRVGKDNVPQVLVNRYMYLATGACQLPDGRQSVLHSCPGLPHDQAEQVTFHVCLFLSCKDFILAHTSIAQAKPVSGHLNKSLTILATS